MPRMDCRTDAAADQDDQERLAGVVVRRGAAGEAGDWGGHWGQHERLLPNTTAFRFTFMASAAKGSRTSWSIPTAGGSEKGLMRRFI